MDSHGLNSGTGSVGAVPVTDDRASGGALFTMVDPYEAARQYRDKCAARERGDAVGAGAAGAGAGGAGAADRATSKE